jgi:serine/threonine protein kinase
LELLLPQPPQNCEEQIGQYTLKKVLKDAESKIGFSIGLYTKGKNSFVIKTVNFRTHHQLYQLLLNEAFMTKFLAENVSDPQFMVPQFVELFEQHHKLYFIRTYVEREERTSSQQDHIKGFTTCVDSFRSIPFQKYPELPRSTAFYSFIWMIPYFVVSSLKKPQHTGIYFSLLKQYFASLTLADFISPNLSLAHRDLTPDNVFISKGKVGLIDLETMIVGSYLTDLANFPRKYFGTLSRSTIQDYLSQKVTTDIDRRTFTWLSVFYLLQYLAVEDTANPYYTEAISFLPFFTGEILPRFKPSHRSLYECCCTTLFTLLSFFFGSSKQNIILCYHSVGLTDWRFSTPPKCFEDQVNYLMRHYTVVPLSTLLTHPERSDQVSITFDDGYEDVLTHALPILKRKGLTATVFALGDPQHANRNELSNNLPLLSNSQLKLLRDEGWEIGFHTSTHPDLSSLTPAECEAEIVDGKRAFEKTLGSDVTYFAYPRGMYNNQIVEVVKKAGFTAAFTVDSGLIDAQDPHKITRVPLEGTVSLGEFRGLLTDVGLVMHRLLLRSLQVKENFSRLRNGRQIQ